MIGARCSCSACRVGSLPEASRPACTTRPRSSAGFRGTVRSTLGPLERRASRLPGSSSPPCGSRRPASNRCSRRRRGILRLRRSAGRLRWRCPPWMALWWTLRCLLELLTTTPPTVLRRRATLRARGIRRPLVLRRLAFAPLRGFLRRSGARRRSPAALLWASLRGWLAAGLRPLKSPTPAGEGSWCAGSRRGQGARGRGASGKCSHSGTEVQP